ncbi:Scramblase-domain-containing protein, partial [Baffinella frigidus]
MAWPPQDLTKHSAAIVLMPPGHASQPAVMSSFCPSCGTPAGGAQFCPSCGTAVQGGAAAPPMAQAMDPPMGGGGGGALGMLAHSNTFTIQQARSTVLKWMWGCFTGLNWTEKVQMMEAVTMGCVEQANVYDIIDATNNRKIMVVEEVSDATARCCCGPTHSLLLHFYAVDGAGNKAQPLMTLERPGCCQEKPCVGQGPMDMCLDEMKLHQGFLEGTPGELPTQMLMGSAKMPSMAGGFTPSLEVFDKGNGLIAKVEATGQVPCLFGGMSEMCCDQFFTISTQQGPMGQIVKRKPKDMTSGLAEMFTDADTFTLELSQNLSVEQKANMIGSLLLLDYMFFERDTDGFSFEDGGIAINLFNCYCYGCICPCKCQCSGGGGG